MSIYSVNSQSLLSLFDYMLKRNEVKSLSSFNTASYNDAESSADSIYYTLKKENSIFKISSNEGVEFSEEEKSTILKLTEKIDSGSATKEDMKTLVDLIYGKISGQTTMSGSFTEEKSPPLFPMPPGGGLGLIPPEEDSEVGFNIISFLEEYLLNSRESDEKDETETADESQNTAAETDAYVDNTALAKAIMQDFLKAYSNDYANGEVQSLTNVAV